MIKGLLDSDIPTALFITQDLVDTIRKMKGWKVLPFTISVDFHGEQVKKILVINRWDVLVKLFPFAMDELVRPKIREASSNVKRSIKNFGGKAAAIILKNKGNIGDIEDDFSEFDGEK